MDRILIFNHLNLNRNQYTRPSSVTKVNQRLLFLFLLSEDDSHLFKNILMRCFKILSHVASFTNYNTN